MVFFLYTSHSMEDVTVSFQGGGGGGGGQWDFFMMLIVFNFMIIFFWSFHNDTSVVWIFKTVSIDANYLLKLETFLIHFDEGKGACIRSSAGNHLFPGKRRKKSMVKSREFVKIIFFALLSRHQTESKRTESA